MESSINRNFLESTIKLFLYYKGLGEKTFAQLDDAQLQWRYNADSNSIAIIVHHLSGNMLSRWTDFLTADGEKPWRNRDAEFEIGFENKTQMLEAWEKGWKCLMETLNELQEEDLSKIVYIRNEGQSVVEVINRQLAHYASHVGQIMFVGKQIKGNDWVSLSIPRGGSQSFNNDKFGQEKTRKHFTDGMK